MKLARKGHLNGTLIRSSPSRARAIISGYVLSGQFQLELELSDASPSRRSSPMKAATESKKFEV